MADGDRRKIAWTLSRAAQCLPPADRQAFREFLFSLPGAEPKARQTHSWKKGKGRKGKISRRPRSKIGRQMKLDL